MLDNGYHKDYLEKKVKEIDEKILNFIRIEITKKISPDMKEKSKKENPDKNGFVVQAKRRILERTNTWINQCRVLWKNCEGKLSTSEAKIRLCSIRLILRNDQPYPYLLDRKDIKKLIRSAKLFSLNLKTRGLQLNGLVYQ